MRWRDLAAASVVFSVCAVLSPGCYSVQIDFSREALERQGTPPPCDVILVPGCPPRPDETPSTCIRRRVGAAVAAWREGAARALLFSGGAVRTRRPEALVMAAFARSLGVPESVIAVELEARHTSENVSRSLPILRSRGWKRVLIVTDALQLPPALFLARGHGLAVYGRLAHPELSVRDIRRSVELDGNEPLRRAWSM